MSENRRGESREGRAVQCKRLNFNREKYAFSKLYMWITELKWVVKWPTHNCSTIWRSHKMSSLLLPFQWLLGFFFSPLSAKNPYPTLQSKSSFFLKTSTPMPTVSAHSLPWSP